MYKIAIYGKGGSGKSTISAALSVHFARQGKKILHVGCDPKADSTLTLTDGRRITTLLDLLGQGQMRPEPEAFIVSGRFGIDCIEAGGPKPGAGCGGRGIARMFELFEELQLLRTRDYDIVIFDVLGDVVCGGFAAPLRLGFADRAFIVVSEEPLSIYAANNITYALESYASNGVRLGGLILNVSDDLSAQATIERFAAAVQTTVAGIIPRDREIQRIERNHRTAAELSEDSPTRHAIEQLAANVEAVADLDLPRPRPVEVDELFLIMGGVREGASEVTEAEPDCPDCTDNPKDSPGSPEDQSDVSKPPEEPAIAEMQRRLPANREVYGGKTSRSAITRLLGLEGRQFGKLLFEVRGFVFRKGAFFIALTSPSLGDLELELMPGKNVRSYARVRDFSVSHTTPLNKAVRKVLDHLLNRLRRSSVIMRDFARLLELDPDSETSLDERTRKDDTRRQVGFAPRHWTVWGNEGTRGIFIFEHERSRQVLAEVHLGDGAARIHHGTEACQASEQDTNLSSSHFVRHPWRLGDRGQEHRPVAGHFLTNVRDYELIAGSNDNLAAAYEALRNQGHDGPVLVDISCTPVIAGEDWQGVTRRFAEAYNHPVVVSAVGGTDLTGALVKAGCKVLESAVPVSKNARRGVHLIGFPKTRSSRELSTLLASSGVPVLQRQLPQVSLSGLGEFTGARAQLFWPQAEYEVLYSELFKTASVPALDIIPPFGIEATLAFLRQARDAAGSAGELPEEVLEQAAAATEVINGLRERSAALRVGIALSMRQSDVLDDPGKMCGVPVVPFLESLGFSVEILHDSQDAKRLEWWLKSGFSMLYSDLTYDRRFLEVGAALFSLADLEPGIEGALRTLRRLLRRGRAGFFSNYARYSRG